MRKIVCLFVPFLILLSLSCAKKKTEEKVDGLWYVTLLENKYYSASYVGSCQFDSDGSGVFDIKFYNPLAQIDVVNTSSFKWSNTKNTLTLLFDSTGERIYYKIEHLSKKMLKINSGDYTYAKLTMARD